MVDGAERAESLTDPIFELYLSFHSVEASFDIGFGYLRLACIGRVIGASNIGMVIHR